MINFESASFEKLKSPAKALANDKTGCMPDYEYENNDKNEDAVNFSNFDSVWNHGIISGPDPRSIGHFISETYRTFSL